MLTFLPPPLLGVVMLVFLCVNTLFWAIPIYIAILFKLIVPRGAVFDAISRLASWLAQQWAMANVAACDFAFRWEWDVRIKAPLDRHGQYLACSNHLSWNDILVSMKAFGRRAPFFKFFLKQELMWVPVLNLAWWGLDFPFMKRYSREQIAGNPALKGTDLETTRRACEKFRSQPLMLLNYLEGTRFTTQKHAQQKSPYRHLLKPRSGGFAFAISAMGGQLRTLLDITIVYPGGALSFWDFLCGRMRRVIVEVTSHEVPADFHAGRYDEDPAFRKRFQAWIAELWERKDRRIGEIKAEIGAAP